MRICVCKDGSEKSLALCYTITQTGCGLRVHVQTYSRNRATQSNYISYSF